jgi:recombination protein RecA
VDAEDVFDPLSAAEAGVRLARLLWVRCGGGNAGRNNDRAEQALKAADLLIQGGGFGVVAMDLGDTPAASARRISLTSWFRLRRAVEYTPAVLLTVGRQSYARTCASLQLECRRQRETWSGARGTSRLLRGIQVRASSTNRSKACSPVFTATAI